MGRAGPDNPGSTPIAQALESHPMIPALIVCHGQLGEAFLAALAGIYGEVAGLASLSNDGHSAESLERTVEAAAAALGDEGLVFTDYFGGSCATACLAVIARRPGLRLISGVNLPILLYYIAHRHELDLEALARGVAHRGQNSVRELTPPTL